MQTKAICAALLAMSLAGPVMGQTADQPTIPETPAITVPLSAGTAINASLIEAIDSEKSKPGDPVSALVTESVVYQRSVLVPKGSRIVGRVVRTGADGEESSAVFVEFDRVILKNGQEALLNAGIQALAAPTAAPTIPSRKDYEESWIAGTVAHEPVVPAKPGTVVVPSTYTTPRRSAVPDLPAQKIEGGLDRQGKFTPDSKGAFGEPNLRIFTPVSEGSHGTVLLGHKKSLRLESGTHLLIVVQPPTASPDVRQ
jgi:hypothetical protein